MFADAKVLIFIASCAVVAQAQSASMTTSASTALPSGLDQCIITCSSQAAAATGCGTYTNLTCVCTSSPFQEAAGACLQANCTSSDVAAAQQIQAQECAALTNGSATASTTPSTATATSASATAATHSGAAMALSAPFSLGGLLGTLVASAGALVGAAFVL